MLIFTLPVAFLPFPVAHFIWQLSIQLFLIAGVWLTSRQVHWPRSINQLTVFLFLAVIFIPNTQNTIWGQFSTIAVISVALTYRALRKERYLLAGFWSFGLTFKPQVMLFTIAFLSLWALFDKRRWRFLLGLGLTAAAAWAFAEIFQPNWVVHFLQGMSAYKDYYDPPSVMDRLWQYGLILEALVLILALGVFIYHRRSAPRSAAFIACLVLSMSAWWLATPVQGMMHMAALPVALVLLFSILYGGYPRLYQFGILAFSVLYLVGFAGFIYGLSNSELYGTHIQLAELAYKLLAPILLTALALPVIIKPGAANPFSTAAAREPR